jgi:hypothetical protein
MWRRRSALEGELARGRGYRGAEGDRVEPTAEWHDSQSFGIRYLGLVMGRFECRLSTEADLPLARNSTNPHQDRI